MDTVSGNWELGRKNLGIWENRQRNLGIWELGFLWELGIQVVKTGNLGIKAVKNGNLGIEFLWELGIIDGFLGILFIGQKNTLNMQFLSAKSENFRRFALAWLQINNVAVYIKFS